MGYKTPEHLCDKPGFYTAQFPQFAVHKEPQNDQEVFANAENLGKEAAERGYGVVQVHTWDNLYIDIHRGADSAAYCDDWQAALAKHGGVRVSDLGLHCQTQCMAIHPSTEWKFGGFAPPNCVTDLERVRWVYSELEAGAKTTERLQCNPAMALFSGELIWTTCLYKFPQQPPELVKAGFNELGRRWKPGFNILDAHGVDGAFERHLQEDVHDGITFERLKEASGNHTRCRLLLDHSHFKLMGIDELADTSTYVDEFRMQHNKDAEDIPDSSGKESLFTYQPWAESRARYRSLGYGQIRFREYYNILKRAGVRLPSVYEWEDPLMSSDQALREGAIFLQALIDGKELPGQNKVIPAEHAFDDFVANKLSQSEIRQILGIGVDEIDWDQVARTHHAIA